jgi:hypothetical protein
MNQAGQDQGGRFTARLSNAAGIVLAGLLVAAPAATARAQEVYRCEGSDGSVTFSDLPCASAPGTQETVDATPHQGHRASSAGGEPAYTMPEAQGGDERREASQPTGPAETLPRSERLSLERRRDELLSGLKRRHLDPRERRAMTDELREVDEKLGIGAEDVADMPFHNREVYEDNAIHPGLSGGPFSR